jgi:hypothetical protein
MMAQNQIDLNMAALEERVKRRSKGNMATDDFEPSTLGMFSAVDNDEEDGSDDDDLYDDEDDEDFEDEYGEDGSLPYDALNEARVQWPASYKCNSSGLQNPHPPVQCQAPIQRRSYGLSTGTGTASQLARAVLLRRAFGGHAPCPYPPTVMEGDGTTEPFDSFPSPVTEPPPYTPEPDSEVDFDLPVRFAGMEIREDVDGEGAHPDDPFATPYYPEDTLSFDEHVPEQVYERCSSPVPPDTMSIPSKRHGSGKARSPLPNEFMAIGVVA